VKSNFPAAPVQKSRHRSAKLTMPERWLHGLPISMQGVGRMKPKKLGANRTPKIFTAGGPPGEVAAMEFTS